MRALFKAQLRHSLQTQTRGDLFIFADNRSWHLGNSIGASSAVRVWVVEPCYVVQMQMHSLGLWYLEFSGTVLRVTKKWYDIHNQGEKGKKHIVTSTPTRTSLTVLANPINSLCHVNAINILVDWINHIYIYLNSTVAVWKNRQEKIRYRDQGRFIVRYQLLPYPCNSWQYRIGISTAVPPVGSDLLTFYTSPYSFPTTSLLHLLPPNSLFFRCFWFPIHSTPLNE